MWFVVATAWATDVMLPPGERPDAWREPLGLVGMSPVTVSTGARVQLAISVDGGWRAVGRRADGTAFDVAIGRPATAADRERVASLLASLLRPGPTLALPPIPPPRVPTALAKPPTPPRAAMTAPPPPPTVDGVVETPSPDPAVAVAVAAPEPPPVAEVAVEAPPPPIPLGPFGLGDGGEAVDRPRHETWRATAAVSWQPDQRPGGTVGLHGALLWPLVHLSAGVEGSWPTSWRDEAAGSSSWSAGPVIVASVVPDGLAIGARFGLERRTFLDDDGPVDAALVPTVGAVLDWGIEGRAITWRPYASVARDLASIRRVADGVDLGLVSPWHSQFGLALEASR